LVDNKLKENKKYWKLVGNELKENKKYWKLVDNELKENKKYWKLVDNELKENKNKKWALGIKINKRKIYIRHQTLKDQGRHW
jgi:hypothetical protein